MIDGTRGAKTRRVATVGALCLGLAAAVALWPRPLVIDPTTSGTVPPTASWPRDYVVRPGDQVVGVGELLEADDSRLCTGTDSIINATYHCSSLSVVLQGIDIGSLPGARRTDGTVYVFGVSVRGTWDGTVLHVDRLGGNVLQLPISPLLTCQFVVPGAVDDAAGEESAYTHLQSIVDGDPRLFAGSWVAEGPRRMIVVATTGDIVATGTSLRQNFPFPLCLVHVTYSLADLNALAGRLQPPAGQAWRPEVDIQRNKVLVRVRVLDGSLLQTAGAEPSVEFVPLVFKDL